MKQKNYNLTFCGYFPEVGGALANIYQVLGPEVWGAVYELDGSKIDELDLDEGVDQGIYRPIYVPVESCGGDLLCCQAYKLIDSNEHTPQRPSNTYMNMLLHGALEVGLPKPYIEKLKDVQTNGHNVHMPFH